MAKLFHLKVNTPNGILFEDDIYQIELSTPVGQLGILAEHEPIIGSIQPSVCHIRDGKGNRVSALVNSGIFKMDGKTINIISDFFEFSENVNESVFDLRLKHIQNAILSISKNEQVMYQGIQHKLEEELADLRKVAIK